ncbi:hypothetical protein MXB_3061, partial [Myxobolus squamalis]
MEESPQIILPTKKLSKYEQVLMETIKTEECFIKDLESILENYGQFFDTFGQDKIFFALKNSLINLLTLATSIYQLLVENKTNLTKICQIFIDRKDDFAKYYGIYCELFPLANSMIDNFIPGSEYRIMVEKCWIESNQSLPLTCYLVKPVQRILKYHLLIFNKKLAIEQMKDVGSRINEKQRIHDGYAELPILRKKIVNLKDPLRFSDVGPVLLQDTMMVNNKPRRLILFENVLMVASICENDTLCVKEAFMTEKLVLTEETSKGSLVFSIKAEKKATRVYHIKKLSAMFGSEYADKIRCKASASSLLNIGEILANIDREDSNNYNQQKTKLPVVKHSKSTKRKPYAKNKASNSNSETIKTVANVMEVFNRQDQVSDLNVEMPWNKEFIQDAANKIKDVLYDDSDKNSITSFEMSIESESHRNSPYISTINLPDISLNLALEAASTPATDAAIEIEQNNQKPSNLITKIG